MAGQLTRRVTRLEQALTPEREGYLLVSRSPDETDVEAVARWGIEPDAWPHVRVRPWFGGRNPQGGTTPPVPVWVPTTWTPQDAADVVQRTRRANERIQRQRRENMTGREHALLSAAGAR